jgi:hypothetical protein
VATWLSRAGRAAGDDPAAMNEVAGIARQIGSPDDAAGGRLADGLHSLADLTWRAGFGAQAARLPGRRAVAGRVTDAAGGPVEGALVHVFGLREAVRTAADGRFNLPGVPTHAPVLVTASAPATNGIQPPPRATVRIGRGADEPVALQLPAAATAPAPPLVLRAVVVYRFDPAGMPHGIFAGPPGADPAGPAAEIPDVPTDTPLRFPDDPTATSVALASGIWIAGSADLHRSAAEAAADGRITPVDAVRARAAARDGAVAAVLGGPDGTQPAVLARSASGDEAGRLRVAWTPADDPADALGLGTARNWWIERAPAAASPFEWRADAPTLFRLEPAARVWLTGDTPPGNCCGPSPPTSLRPAGY